MKLYFIDKIKVLLTPDAVDLLSDRGIKQAKQIAEDQLQYFKNHPGSFGSHIRDIIANRREILGMVHKYYLDNKSYFQYLAKNNPQHWSDPEHVIMGMIRDLIAPSTFIF